MNTADVGSFGLSMAMLVAAGAILAAATAVRLDMPRALVWARRLVYAFAGLTTLAGAALLSALFDNDFRLAYVVSYSERAMPGVYKFAAFWAGQEGSLLLWALLLGVLSAIAAVQLRARPMKEQAVVLAALATVCGFFAALMLFAADPFKLSPVVPADGHGLNPLLQHPSMAAHPPLLFVGYAGFTIPWAIMLGALVSGRSDNGWVVQCRRWLVASWLFLGVGILLGAQWAYMELGWGGYWMWDPVENASLLPWLTGTAALHSIGVQMQRGMFKRWNAGLIAVTFLLCILGTWITRSGIQSVHAFEQSRVGTLFLVFLIAATLASVGVLVWRRRCLEPEREMEQLVGKEGAFLAVNALLMLMTVVTLIGTIWPLIDALIGTKMIVDQRFYNTIVAPMGLALVALMAIGPVLSYGRDAATKLVRGLIVPGAAGVLALVIALAMGLMNLWALACVLIVVVGVFAFSSELIHAVRMRMKLDHEAPVTALTRLIDSNHRRYGGQFVHLGMMMIVVGIVGSSVFNVKQQFQNVSVGQSVQAGGYTMTLTHLHEVRGVNYGAMEAQVTLTDADGRSTLLKPQLRRYDKSSELNSEVAIRSSLAQDIYVTLLGMDPGTQTIALQAIVNPLVLWIWIGGIVLTLGGLLSTLPRLLPLPRTQSVKLPVGIQPCTNQ